MEVNYRDVPQQLDIAQTAISRRFLWTPFPLAISCSLSLFVWFCFPKIDVFPDNPQILLRRFTMRVVLQRVKEANVAINQEIVGEISKGYLLLVGFEQGDDQRFLEPMIDKVLKIKLFPDEQGRFAHAVTDINASLLIVSQFTLFADLKKGKKPSLSKALEPDMANALYNQFVELCHQKGINVASGRFGADMQVSLQNDGPVTILLDTKELFPSLY